MQPESPGNLGTPSIPDFQVQDQLSLMNGCLGLVFVDIAELNLTPWLNFKISFLTWSIELKYLVVLRKNLTYKRSQWWYQLNFLSPKQKLNFQFLFTVIRIKKLTLVFMVPKGSMEATKRGKQTIVLLIYDTINPYKDQHGMTIQGYLWLGIFITQIKPNL